MKVTRGLFILSRARKGRKEGRKKALGMRNLEFIFVIISRETYLIHVIAVVTTPSDESQEAFQFKGLQTFLNYCEVSIYSHKRRQTTIKPLQEISKNLFAQPSYKLLIPRRILFCALKTLPPPYSFTGDLKLREAGLN